MQPLSNANINYGAVRAPLIGGVGGASTTYIAGVQNIVVPDGHRTFESEWHIAQLEEELVQGGSAYCRIYGVHEGSWQLTDNFVRVWGYVIPGYYTLLRGTTVRIEWHDGDNKGDIEGLHRWLVTGVYYL